jgi:iron complex outermembrane receptor protein
MPRVMGIVTDNNGNPVENATITIPTAGVFALSDEHGNFVIDDVSPGTHTLFAVHRNFQKFAADLSIINDLMVTLELDKQG